MSPEMRAMWDERHRGRPPGDPEPFFAEMLPQLRRGRALDVAAGRGRHSLALARAGFSVIAVDQSMAAMEMLAAAARAERLPILAAVADMSSFPLRPRSFDLIVNINFLERALIPNFTLALKPGGALLFDTFLIDQAALGYPRDRAFLLNHYELRDLLAGFDLVQYREGITVYPDGNRAWRASALAIRRSES